MAIRIGVDVGGTFTDLCLFDDGSRLVQIAKVPSVPALPEQAVMAGVRRILRESGYQPEQVGFLVHGTTIATNAILEYKGAKVGLLVTEGFRDVLQIVRQDRPKLYDYFAQHAPPLAPRHRTYEVRERMLYTGEVKTPLDESAARKLLANIKKSGEIEVLSVCLLHSYANPIHEQRIRELIQEEIPGMKVSLSSEVLPEIKEYERTITTVVNAYLLPVVSTYLLRVQEEMRSMNLRSALYIMQSNGGVMTATTAAEKSVHTVLSGPAAGALAATWMGRRAGYENLISIDMGGTSADVSLTHAGKLTYANESQTGGHVIKVPTIDIHSVGAGGGSIAWVDHGGALCVGPASAGADPGPACYGKGGADATVTDANLVLGRLNPDYFLGGEIAIDVEAAGRVIIDKIARPLGLGLEQAAEGILKIVNATMVKGIRRVSVEKGHDPREFTLFAFGGGGPLHGATLAAELDIPEVLIPAAAGVGSALGCIVADFRHDYVQTVLGRFLQFTVEDLEHMFAGLEKKALEQMDAEGLSPGQVVLQRSADMRYAGQGFEIQVSVPSGPMDPTHMKVIEEGFRALYLRAYGYESGDATELVGLRVTAFGKLPPVELLSQPKVGTDATHAVKGARRVFFEGEYRETQIYDGYKLQAGNQLGGPAIVERHDSTAMVLPHQMAYKDEQGNLHIAFK